MAKRKTNIKFVQDVMSFSNYGALSQAFIMEAIREKVDQVSKHKVSDYPENSFVCPKAWIGVAKEIKDKLDIHYSNKL